MSRGMHESQEIERDMHYTVHEDVRSSMVDSVVRDLTQDSVINMDDIYDDAIRGEGYDTLNDMQKREIKECFARGESYKAGELLRHGIVCYIANYHRSVVEEDLEAYSIP